MIFNSLMSHSSLNHTHRSLTAILTEPWINVLVKIKIFRKPNCLLLLTAQLMTADDLNA